MGWAMLEVLTTFATFIAGVFLGAYLETPKRDARGRFTK